MCGFVESRLCSLLPVCGLLGMSLDENRALLELSPSHWPETIMWEITPGKSASVYECVPVADMRHTGVSLDENRFSMTAPVTMKHEK